MNRFAFNETYKAKEHKNYLDKKYLEIVEEYFDVTDTKTRDDLLSVNEADQSKVILALTEKLYKSIVEKVDDIDYGDIPATKGDITKLPNFNKITECLNVMGDLLVQYKQDTKPIDTIKTALDNIITRRELFERAFKLNAEMPIVIYCNICLAIINSLSLMIATSIEFIKTPSQDSFTITLDKVGVSKTMQSMLYTNLVKFNKTCKTRELDSAVDYMIKNKVKSVAGVRESATFGFIGAALAVTGAIITAGAAIVLILRNIKELVFYFYNARTRLSEYFDLQADLLQVNAYNLQSNEINKTPEEKQKIIKKQLHHVENFRKLSNFFAIKNKESENKATKELTNDDNKLKSDDLTDDDSDMTLF